MTSQPGLELSGGVDDAQLCYGDGARALPDAASGWAAASSVSRCRRGVRPTTGVATRRRRRGLLQLTVHTTHGRVPDPPRVRCVVGVGVVRARRDSPRARIVLTRRITQERRTGGRDVVSLGSIDRSRQSLLLVV